MLACRITRHLSGYGIVCRVTVRPFALRCCRLAVSPTPNQPYPLPGLFDIGGVLANHFMAPGLRVPFWNRSAGFNIVLSRVVAE